MVRDALRARQHSATARYEGDWTLSRTGMSADGKKPVSGSRAARTWTDALGRTSKVQHFTATDLTTSVDTSYVYNPRGELAQVTDAKGNKWTYTYDARGRLVSSTDPDMGAAYFGYDKLDQRIWSKDSRNRAQYTTYDVLGRQTELRDDSSTGPLVAKWTYDTLPGAKGLPVASTRYHQGAAFTTEVTGYDKEYRPTGSRITIPSTPLTTGLAGTYAYKSTYTETGLIRAVDLPATPGGLAAEKVITRYDGEGSPRTTSGLAWYTADTVLSPFGQVLRTASGEAPNRVWATHFYDENTGRRQQSLTDRETLNPSRVSALSYAYDTIGNITSITDQQSAARVDRQCFAYDPMGRLAHAWTAKTAGCPRSSAAQGAGPNRADVSPSVDGAGYWHSYEFDTIGNRTGMKVHDLTEPALDDEYTYTYGKAPTGGPLPTGTQQPHTLTKADATVRTPGQTVTTQSTYAYDASGNTTQRVLDGDTQTLNWDRRNKLSSVDTDDNGKPDVTYLYDASGNRLVEDDGSRRTLYLGEAEIVVDTSGRAVEARRYYTHPGAPTTVRTTAGKPTGHKLTVLLTDHHNTAETAIDLTAGQPVTRRKYDPYGNPRGTEPSDWPDRRTFLGVGINDTATGLTHIGAREYDATTGRFISADPLIDLTDPLQMNGYTYANGNPLTYADPSGLRPIGDCERGCSSTDGNTTTYKQDHFYLGPNGQYVYNSTTTAVTTGHRSRTTVTVKATYSRSTGRTYRYSGQQESKTTGSRKYGTSNGWQPAKKLDMEGAHLTLDAVGLIPAAGTPADVANAILYAAEGNWSEAGWSLVAIIPVVGEITTLKRKGDRFVDGFRGIFKRRGICPTQNSFVAGTKVLTADGSSKPIEDLETGDQVIATDPETGETAVKTVTATIFTEDDKAYVDLTVSTDEGPEVIATTDHHPFWSESEQAWLDAGDLKPGMTLRTDTGTTVIIAATRSYGALQSTYNLTVSDLHTYYVLAGQTPVLVHNSGPGCGSIWVDANKVPHHFKHAEDFGITGKESKATKQAFVNALESFVRNPGNVQITGTYRGAAARHYVDPNTGRHVSVDLESGQMLGAWRSDPTSDQFRYLMEQGKL
ncbi:hypothetical protein I3F58_17955 [Streptomyces sp. MUM 203J]|uniref:polymorphic toxin-type HINT domain-containing protein n=1 Tax=Streptomyces sp. MUM 203J TaxID=2791990 RepID=UPI001F04899E|nr:polymorphic toxin-type HINT domain-containing protein [Streptomyces sp. MUM 203J]MCH0541411.1 hypothetical protein [Streptomyces sp. MUM 203J]